MRRGWCDRDSANVQKTPRPSPYYLGPDGFRANFMKRTETTRKLRRVNLVFGVADLIFLRLGLHVACCWRSAKAPGQILFIGRLFPYMLGDSRRSHVVRFVYASRLRICERHALSVQGPSSCL